MIGASPVSGRAEAVEEYISEESRGLDTGFGAIDYGFRGLSGLVVVGGPPGRGKSTFVLNVAQNVSWMDNGPVIFYDTENGAEFVVAKLVARHHNTTIEALRAMENGQRTEKIGDALDSLKDFFLDGDLSQMELDSIEETIKNQKPSLVVFDSLQKLPAQIEAPRRQQVDDWLRFMERMTNQHKCTILCTSELSRGTNDAPFYKVPDLRALKESGGIEYAAATVIFILDTKDPSIKQFTCGKHRFGPPRNIGRYSMANFHKWEWQEVQ
ncbi:MAG: AAA family ATPase [Candidatus Brocadiales bacterium]|nr:AAA family ATPase [Candidatus Bathyanammoxibius sp.]